MASALCWKTHCGVQCAHLTCNDNNSCCLCLAFTVRFIYKHQLPMVLEDSTAKKPLLFVAIILQTLSMSILHAWIFWEMASALCWKIHCGVSSAHLLCNDNNTCCLCLAFTSLWVFCMLGYSGKWHHYSVGKFTLVYRVQIHYAMATMLVACVLQPHQNSTICTLSLHCPYSVLMLSLCCPYDVLISKRTTLHNTT